MASITGDRAPRDSHWFLAERWISEMIVPGSHYWNFAFGRQPGEAAADEEGIDTMATLGVNIAWLLKKIA